MRFLFASMPFDGHVLPMTGFAKHLTELGHEVRFYTGPSFAARLEKLGVPQVPFTRAVEINGQNMAEHFPGIEKLKGPKRIALDVEKIFFANIPAHYADIVELHEDWPFDALVNDGAFYAAYPVTRKLGVPSYAISPAPAPTAKSAGAPPPFFGLTPATNPLTRVKHRVIWAMVEHTNTKAKPILDRLLAVEHLPAYGASIFQLPWDTATVVFQTGVPSMDFEGLHWPDNHVFVGPLLPPRSSDAAPLPYADRLAAASSVIVVSQGTVDNRDPDKLIAPALTALAGGDHLVVACTGSRHTEMLRRRFPQDNVIVVDWADFDALFLYADLFVTNGGYGSVMQALIHEVPVVTAGVLEAKNDVNSRLARRHLGFDLRTERPTPAQVAKAVARVTSDPTYRRTVSAVAAELRSRRPLETMTECVLTGRHRVPNP